MAINMYRLSYYFSVEVLTTIYLQRFAEVLALREYRGLHTLSAD